MKKFIAIVLAAMFTMAMFAGCGSAASTASTASSAAASGVASGNEVTVGVIQFMQHPSLDEIYTAIEKGIQDNAAAYGLNVTIKLQNAQGDTSNINSMCQQFVADGVDAIVAIATPAAQGAVSAVDGTDIPVIFSAVTDPVAAELVDSLEVPGVNVTGTSDFIAVDKIFGLAAELTPEAKTFGLLYNTSEVNSVSAIETAKAYLEANGMSYVEGAVTSTADVQTVTRNLLTQCDAIFSPTDNTVAEAMALVADEAIAAGKPVYCGADSMVNDGGFATIGVNYTNLGTQTADMVLRVLSGEAASTMPVEVLDDAAVVVNAETAAAIGVDVSKYAA